jgi:hypothetical protein
MPNHLSTIGIIHTAISILALIVAFVALFHDGKINPRNRIGKWYIFLTVLTCLTAFGIMKTGHFTPGHGLAVLVLILLPIGFYARSFRLSGNRGGMLEIIIMMLTLFLSFIPAITETVTRLPIDQPIAATPDAPIIKMSFLGLALIFIIGVIFQLRKERTSKSV